MTIEDITKSSTYKECKKYAQRYTIDGDDLANKSWFSFKYMSDNDCLVQSSWATEFWRNREEHTRIGTARLYEASLYKEFSDYIDHIKAAPHGSKTATFHESMSENNGSGGQDWLGLVRRIASLEAQVNTLESKIDAVRSENTSRKLFSRAG